CLPADGIPQVAATCSCCSWTISSPAGGRSAPTPARKERGREKEGRRRDGQPAGAQPVTARRAARAHRNGAGIREASAGAAWTWTRSGEMTRSRQTEYERVAGVLEACADAENRLGGHPYRAEIMRRSAELLRQADALLRTPRG